jgi:hypothetical protein
MNTNYVPNISQCPIFGVMKFWAPHSYELISVHRVTVIKLNTILIFPLVIIGSTDILIVLEAKYPFMLLRLL